MGRVEVETPLTVTVRVTINQVAHIMTVVLARSKRIQKVKVIKEPVPHSN